jgi:hypothetical protein
VGAELFHADRQTHRHDEAKSRSSQIGNAPKNHSNVNGYEGQDVLWERMLYDYVPVQTAVSLRDVRNSRKLT